MHTYRMSRPITIGPGDFEPRDDGWPYNEEEQTETVYRLNRVVVLDGNVCLEWSRVEVSVESHEVKNYPRKCRSCSKVLHLSQYLIAAEWCRKQASKRLCEWRRRAKAAGTYAKDSPRDHMEAHLPRVWSNLVELAAKHGWEIGA
jgi:hypothetical protein